MKNETAESRLKETLFVVEATSCEQHYIWRDFAHNSDARAYKDIHVKWEQLDGWVVTVGKLDNRPICVSMMWNRLDGQLVMFYDVTSQVSDSVQIDAWIDAHFSGKWDNDLRVAKTDAMNFHHCLDAIKEANKKKIVTSKEPTYVDLLDM